MVSSEFSSVPELRTDLAARISAARLVVIDANLAKAELLHFFCTQRWGFDVVAREHTGENGIAAAKRTQPDLVLAALTPPDIRMIDYVKRLRAAAPAAKLVLLATQCNEYIVHVLEATPYHALVCESETNMAMLAQMIERVREGLRPVSLAVQQCKVALRADPDAFPKLLSRRLMEVLVCIAHSMSDEEIARQLGLSSSTVLSHRRKIMGKLNIHKTPKLIRYCHDKGFSSVPPPLSQHLVPAP
jgi:DNA-binding NarL/FixJ family response regulator